MALRAAHGAGGDALIRVETAPLDELPKPNAEDTAEGLAMRAARGRPFQPGNSAAKGRRPALATTAGIPLDAKDPAYKQALGWAKRYRARRVRELGVMHGGELSAGVCAMLTSASLDMAAARYVTALSARTGDVEMLILASKLSMAARQQELTALELASREMHARKASRGPETQEDLMRRLGIGRTAVQSPSDAQSPGRDVLEPDANGEKKDEPR
jgi:hypothetical protein